MCLAIPSKIIKIKGEDAEVDVAGIRKEINVSLMSGLKPGDFVLVHAGFAIEKISAETAKETLDVFEEVYGEQPDQSILR